VSTQLPAAVKDLWNLRQEGALTVEQYQEFLAAMLQAS
jgi:hypothetical protein